MAYSCQFCGEIEDADVLHRCTECGTEHVQRSALGFRCAECEAEGKVAIVCPTCGSDEIEA